ncbi:MAG TPA: RecX family transcriptional regulator [Candidatus Saccharibacteria bacterium]|nr:RecX family transcriptional regulator [Candidatus Saccharibacteria bacterium]
MKITSINPQKRDESRVNISVDGKYRFSLDVSQIYELGIKLNKEINERDIKKFIDESNFGKIYIKTLKYSLIRPRSVREVSHYLYRQKKNEKDYCIDIDNHEKNCEKVLKRLIDKGYVDDKKFAEYWVENRMVKKGISQKKLSLELQQKGVNIEIIKSVIKKSIRSDKEELRKVIERKINRYQDSNKLIRYLIGKGFNYEDIKNYLQEDNL